MHTWKAGKSVCGNVETRKRGNAQTCNRANPEGLVGQCNGAVGHSVFMIIYILVFFSGCTSLWYTGIEDNLAHCRFK